MFNLTNKTRTEYTKRCMRALCHSITLFVVVLFTAVNL